MTSRPDRDRTHDLVVANGRVVTEVDDLRCDVGVRDGVIVEVGENLQGRRTIDAADLLVFPGGVDPHVHLTPMSDLPAGAPVRPDDFDSGSRAAIAGGITTIGNMTHQARAETLGAAIDRDIAIAGSLSAVDYFLHPVLNDPAPSTIRELAHLPDRGVSSVKVFMSFPGFASRIAAYGAALTRAGEAGLITLFHCEDGAAIGELAEDLLSRGRGEVTHYPAARPISTEVSAVEVAVSLAAAAEAPIYVVHLSSQEALEACRRARGRGVDVAVETRPLYLHLTDEVFGRPDGAKYLGNPPMRTLSDRDALWSGLGDGSVAVVASDHAPWTLEQKLDPSRDIGSFLPGVADLETLRPLLYSEGVVTGRISPQTFVAVTATNAARLFGLYPVKGTIQVGADADLVLWDPDEIRIVNGAAFVSRAGYSPYDGMEVRGWPVVTISRGEVVFEDGEVRAAAGRGHFVRSETGR